MVSFGDEYMKKIFFCNSYYHILISIIKIIADNKKNINYIVLTDDNFIIDFSSIAKKIKNNKNKKIYFYCGICCDGLYYS